MNTDSNSALFFNASLAGRVAFNASSATPSPELVAEIPQSISAEFAAQLEQLKIFLATAPTNWTDQNQHIRKFNLPNGDVVSCALWNGIFFITGTDVVKCLMFRFQAIGRPVTNMKKFEEGIFSDLRNLKPGQDASLEEPRSEFLEFLFKNNCVRTQKKQKVFYWYSVPHDRLFIDALERDLKRENLGQETATTRMATQHILSKEIFHVTPQMTPVQPLGSIQQLSVPMHMSEYGWMDGQMEAATPSDFAVHTPPTTNSLTSSFNSSRTDLIDDHMPTIFNDLQSSFEDVSELFAKMSQQSLNTPLIPSAEIMNRKQGIDNSSKITPNLTPVAIAPKLSATPISTTSSPFSSTISLDGSPNYKKQRRRSSIFRLSQNKPYSPIVYQQSVGRRHTQPNIYHADEFLLPQNILDHHQHHRKITNSNVVAFAGSEKDISQHSVFAGHNAVHSNTIQKKDALSQPVAPENLSNESGPVSFLFEPDNFGEIFQLFGNDLADHSDLIF